MFRFSIRDVLWLTVVVALVVALWTARATLTTERESLKARRRELEAKFNRIIDAADRRSFEVAFERNAEREQSMSEQELAVIKEQSARLGAPQPAPLPPGYGEKPNKD